ncbi:MAG: WD40 repeat domain-containing protein [Bacteroidota bacterium]|nr:WD40 repeat domain-containing protein [Bacteroidota bacterium]
MSLTLNVPLINIKKAGEFSGHKGGVYTLAQGADPHSFFSSGGDGLVISWSLKSFGPGVVVARLPSAVFSLIFIEHLNWLVAGTRQGIIYILDLSGNKLLKEVTLAGDIFDLLYIKEHEILTIASVGSLYFLDINSMQIIRQVNPVMENARELAYNTNDSILASGWSDHHIRLYNMSSLKEVYDFKAHENSVFALSFSPHGDALISGGRDAHLRLWKIDEGYAPGAVIPAHLFTINDIVWHPEGHWYATASRDKTVKIWDGRKHQLLKVIDKEKYAAHIHSVNKVLWSSFEGLLISAGDDRIIKIWDLQLAEVH